MRKRRSDWKQETARFVALLLVVQAVLLAFVGGASALPAPRDPFGHVLCMGDASGRRERVPVPDHDPHGGACCTLGCSMFAGTAPVPPAPEKARNGFESHPRRFALSVDPAADRVAVAANGARAPPFPV